MSDSKPVISRRPLIQPLHRRTLLRGAGGVALALPFLEAMRPRKANAAAAPPKRFLTVFAENGIVPGTWFPSGTEKNFTLPMATAPLEPWKNNLIFFDGVDTVCDGTNAGGGHMRGKTGCLTAQPNLNGRAMGMSIDQFIANKIGTSSRFRSIEASIFLKGAMRDGLFFSGPGQVIVPEDDPAKLFARIFSAPLPTGAGATDPGAEEAFNRLRAKKKSVLDHALAEYTRVQGQLGSLDKSRLDNHMEAIRSVERGLTAGPSAAVAGAACKKPAAAGAGGSYIEATKAQMDLVGLALACDLTRVASIQWRSALTSFPWVNVSASHHGLSHQTGSGGPDAQLSRIVQWHVGQFGEMLARLKGAAEGDGSTLLDNTLVYYTNEISIGSHKHNRAPLVMATGNFIQPNGKKLETGRLLKYNGTYHSGVLTVLANLMGVDTPNFGAPQWQKGPIPGVMA